jgi:hypothetical protein
MSSKIQKVSQRWLRFSPIVTEFRQVPHSGCPCGFLLCWLVSVGWVSCGAVCSCRFRVTAGGSVCGSGCICVRLGGLRAVIGGFPVWLVAVSRWCSPGAHSAKAARFGNKPQLGTTRNRIGKQVPPETDRQIRKKTARIGELAGICEPGRIGDNGMKR